MGEKEFQLNRNEGTSWTCVSTLRKAEKAFSGSNKAKMFHLTALDGALLFRVECFVRLSWTIES